MHRQISASPENPLRSYLWIPLISNFHRGRFRSAKKLANQKSENQPDLGTEKGSQTELDNQTALEPQNIPQHTLFVFEFSTTNYTRKGFIGHIQEIIIRSAFLWSWGGELRNIDTFNLFACPYLSLIHI